MYSSVSLCGVPFRVPIHIQPLKPKAKRTEKSSSRLTSRSSWDRSSWRKGCTFVAQKVQLTTNGLCCLTGHSITRLVPELFRIPVLFAGPSIIRHFFGGACLRRELNCFQKGFWRQPFIFDVGIIFYWQQTPEVSKRSF